MNLQNLLYLTWGLGCSLLLGWMVTCRVDLELGVALGSLPILSQVALYIFGQLELKEQACIQYTNVKEQDCR